ncbi:carboxypeptidase-like regulatory domain-containing protein [Nonlabens sp.]|uniref:carboxypeptidase-like regulatory domain-containing protein n=1 Tax=Nonlabens sp. TaxID=1888209 RepID=UPI003265661E
MKILFILLILLITSFCFSQRIITGTVSDADGGLLGAIVTVKGSKIYSITDFDGNYFIEAKSTDTLVFSYTGYDSQEITIGDQNVINVELESELIHFVTITHFYEKRFEIKTEYGINYQTYGIGVMKKFDYPYDFEVSTFLSSNFRENKKFNFQIEKPLRIKGLYLIAGFTHQQVDFESSNFKKNQLFLAKKIGRTRNPFQHIRIIVGQLNFQNHVVDQNNFGLGFQLRKRIANGFYLNTEYNYWDGINEASLKIDYLIKYNWVASFKYQHINNYEEISIGISRSWGYW